MEGRYISVMRVRGKEDAISFHVDASMDLALQVTCYGNFSSLSMSDLPTSVMQPSVRCSFLMCSNVCVLVLTMLMEKGCFTPSKGIVLGKVIDPIS